MKVIEQAYELANRNALDAATATLERGGHAGDADCWVELGAWYLQGSIVSRDLAKSRECFEMAAALGHQQARQLTVNFRGNGTGGPREWSRALQELAGWAASDELARRQTELLGRMKIGRDGDPLTVAQETLLSTSPDVRLFPDFLTHEEASYLVDRAMPLLTPSAVVDPRTGRLIPHPVRTSDNAMFPWAHEDPVVHAINRRIARASATPVDAGEPLQVLRYRPGQEFKPHQDAIPGAENQRILTFLIYLNEGYGGGDTLFTRNGLRVVARTGDGLLFRNVDDVGRPDPTAEHAGMPVTAGEKFIATRWIRQQRFGPL